MFRGKGRGREGEGEKEGGVFGEVIGGGSFVVEGTGL